MGEEVSKNNVNLATTNQCIPKNREFSVTKFRHLLLFCHNSTIPCSHLMSFGLKPTATKYLQVAKSFSKLFSRNRQSGILLTPPDIRNNNHSIRGYDLY